MASSIWTCPRDISSTTGEFESDLRPLTAYNITLHILHTAYVFLALVQYQFKHWSRHLYQILLNDTSNSIQLYQNVMNIHIACTCIIVINSSQVKCCIFCELFVNMSRYVWFCFPLLVRRSSCSSNM